MWDFINRNYILTWKYKNKETYQYTKTILNKVKKIHSKLLSLLINKWLLFTRLKICFPKLYFKAYLTVNMERVKNRYLKLLSLLTNKCSLFSHLKSFPRKCTLKFTSLYFQVDLFSFKCPRNFPLLWNSKLRCGRVHKSTPLDPSLSQLNAVHTTTCYLFKIHFHHIFHDILTSSYLLLFLTFTE
jgi:hypothetical protein